MADPFITEQEVVDEVGRGSASDPGLATIVETACGIVRAYAEQDITQELGDVATLDGNGGESVQLPQVPVTDVQWITIDGESITDDTYTFNTNGIVFRLDGATFADGRQNVRISYDHGYADADIPDEVKGVARELAKRMFVQTVATEEQLGPVRVKYAAAATELTTTEKIILQKLRRVR